MSFDWRDPEQLHAAAVELRERSRAAQGLPPHIEGLATLNRLAALIDDPDEQAAVKADVRRAS